MLKTARLLSLVLAAALVLAPTGAVAEPTIVAPQQVPIGGLCIVRVDGLAADAKFSWLAIPEVQTADLQERDGSPVLFVATDKAGVYHVVLAYLDAGEVRQAMAKVTVGTPGPVPPPVDPPVTPPTTKATKATYVYEKDDHAIPTPVLATLNTLNRQYGILATVIEADVTDGTGDVPEQYREALTRAKAEGLPCLVVSGESGVIRVVKNPTTEAAVMEAVR